jgi:hypothetical protein
MKVAGQIRKKISKFPEDKTFGYADLGIAKENFFTTAKALERLQKKGLIKKMKKGIFYKPKKTIFGELEPSSNEILNRYLFKNGKRIAYETSYSLYNKLGLTTQMAFKIKVATKGNPIKIDIGSLKVSSVKSYVDVTDENYQLLGYLDALKDIKSIPDCSVYQAVKRMSFIIKELAPKKQNELIDLALFYPARVKTLLGAIMENLKLNLNLEKLKNSINPLTKVKLGLKETELPTLKNWNIV